jgi:SAM-dependent methyltransferase
VNATVINPVQFFKVTFQWFEFIISTTRLGPVTRQRCNISRWPALKQDEKQKPGNMQKISPSDPPYDYRDIFELRGRLYHQAMREHPDARINEFQSVINEADIAPGMTVVDVPSGGAYLSSYLEEVELFGLETSETFAQLGNEKSPNVLLFDNNRFPLKDASIDRVLSIAGLHHVENKRVLFSEMKRVLKPGGRVVVADVAEDSTVRNFLDDFVGRYSDTGHSGWYFGADTRAELSDAGLNIVTDKRLNYLWCAPNMEQLADFCRLLFGMVNADTSTVADGIRDYLGTREHNGLTGLNWQLQCFSCTG